MAPGFISNETRIECESNGKKSFGLCVPYVRTCHTSRPSRRLYRVVFGGHLDMHTCMCTFAIIWLIWHGKCSINHADILTRPLSSTYVWTLN